MSDYFSRQAIDYARYRPTYPAELFTWLVSQVGRTASAWDCACGNGQATSMLAEHFLRVVATDISAQQLAQAPNLPNVTWRVAPAHDSGLPDQSMDLITVAQALHWFDLDKFYAEVRRTLVPDGIVAVWSYAKMRIHNKRIAAVLEDFYTNVIGPYWPPERKFVENGYRDLAFPFELITAPVFTMRAKWTLDQLMGYIRSWSATSLYRQNTNQDACPKLRATLNSLWPHSSTHAITIAWPLTLRVGRLAK